MLTTTANQTGDTKMNATKANTKLIARVAIVMVDICCPICKEFIANGDDHSFNYELAYLPTNVHCNNCDVDLKVGKTLHRFVD